MCLLSSVSQVSYDAVLLPSLIKFFHLHQKKFLKKSPPVHWLLDPFHFFLKSRTGQLLTQRPIFKK